MIVSRSRCSRQTAAEAGEKDEHGAECNSFEDNTIKATRRLNVTGDGTMWTGSLMLWHQAF